MCHPLKVWRKWTRKVNLPIRRAAIASAIASTCSTDLIVAKGHRCEKVPEFPLVLKASNT